MTNRSQRMAESEGGDAQRKVDEFTKTVKIDYQQLKSIPRCCSWSNTIFEIDEWDVADGRKVGVSHGLCPKCLQKLLDQQ